MNIGSEYDCDNLDKFGKHPSTNYVAGRIASKSKRICKRKMDSKTQSSWR